MKFQAIWSRFWKGFWSAGVAAVAVELAQSRFEVASITDLGTLAWAVVSAFVTGGILATIKWWNWK